MPKFRFKSGKKYKLNFINDNDEVFKTDAIEGPHIEIFSNKSAIIEGCKSIIEYQDNYIKIKIKKGFLSLSGIEFLITSFEDDKIIIKGIILSVEFCV